MVEKTSGKTPKNQSFFLKGLSNSVSGRYIRLNGGILIGRASECDLAIRDTRISRRHARIEPKEGRYRILDLGSVNGIFLNGHRIEAGFLQDGDIVAFDEIRFQFTSQDPRAPEKDRKPGEPVAENPAAPREEREEDFALEEGEEGEGREESPIPWLIPLLALLLLGAVAVGICGYFGLCDLGFLGRP